MFKQQGLKAKFKSRQQGAVAIIVAICLVVLIGMLGLVLDLGHLYVTKTELQNVADAAALSGAKELDGTADGVSRAYDKASEVALLNNYNFNTVKGFNLVTSNLEFSSSPNGPWDSFNAAVASPAGKTFLKVNTGAQDLNTWFIHVLPAAAVMRTHGMAVAGRFVNPITPIGLCALTSNKEVTINGEGGVTYKSYYGYRKGVSYNFASVNRDFGGLTSGAELYLHPTATSQANCNPSQGSASFMAPFLCTGQSAISGALGSHVYANTGVAAGMSIAALNTRFSQYGPPLDAGLNNVSCAPDKNIKSFNPVTAKRNPAGTSGWMTSGETLEQTVIPKLAEWLENPGTDTAIPASIRDLKESQGGCLTGAGTGDCSDNYGVLWAYSREVQTNNGVAVAWADWSKKGLYPGGPTASWTQSATDTPYIYGIKNPSTTETPFFKSPGYAGVEGRRLLNVVLVDCPGVNPGICGELDVIGVGQFFMQTPASVSDFITGEFVKLLSDAELSGDIRLYR